MQLHFKRAAVGSTNPAKVEAVRLALARLAPACTVEAVVAPGRATSHTPVGDEATRRGAELRGRAALADTGADVAFGLEGGVLFEGDGVGLTSWVVAVTPDGRTGYGGGFRMPLPGRIVSRLRADEELGPLIDELFGTADAKRSLGAIGLLTDGFVSRADAFADLVAMSLAPWLHEGLYR